MTCVSVYVCGLVLLGNNFWNCPFFGIMCKICRPNLEVFFLNVKCLLSCLCCIGDVVENSELDVSKNRKCFLYIYMQTFPTLCKVLCKIEDTLEEADT